MGNVTGCYKLVKSVERKGITTTPTNGEFVHLQVDLKITQNFKRGMV